MPSASQFSHEGGVMEENEFKVETVKVVRPDHDGGFAIINKSDLTDADVLFDDAKRKAAPALKSVKTAGKSDDSDD